MQYDIDPEFKDRDITQVADIKEHLMKMREVGFAYKADIYTVLINHLKHMYKVDREYTRDELDRGTRYFKAFIESHQVLYIDGAEPLPPVDL